MSIPVRTMLITLLVLSLISSANARRQEAVSRSPVAVTAISKNQIEMAGITDMEQALDRVLVTRFTGGSYQQDSNPQISLRGINSSQTLTYINDRPLGTMPVTKGFPLFDLERIEVLKGPQSTLYGRQAISGVVMKITRSTVNHDYESNYNWSATKSIRFGDSHIDSEDYSWMYSGDSDDNTLNSNLLLNDGYFDPNWQDWWDLNLATERYNYWGTAFTEVEFDDLFYIKRDVDPNATPPPPPKFSIAWWSNEFNKWLEKKSADYPNDPLYPKKGSEGKTSTARKAIGGLLSMFGSPVELSKEGASAQWGLPETGFRRRGSDDSAWDVAAGEQKNVVVAVIDSGLDLTHIDGPQYVWTNPDEIAGNGIDDDSNGYVDDIHGWNFYSESNDITDDNGHGTFVAGIIAAKTNNGEGIAGINPGARIMPLKVLNREGKSRILSVYRAIRYAVDNGARVINLSLGGKGVTRLEQIGINYAYAMGCIVVVAAGNERGDIVGHGPPGARRAFSVASMDMDGKPRKSSNRGLNVALTAPGESIYSLTAKEGNRDGKFMPLAVGKYFRSNGTSFSAPFVAGTASLIWSKYPDLSHRMVEDMILQSAKDIHDPGWDPYTGYGLLDGHGALTQDPRQLLVPRITEIHVNREKRRISSVDLYGVIRGSLDHFTVSVGRGKKPTSFKKVYGPASIPVDYRLISRIDGIHFAKGSHWTVKVDAVDKNQRTKSIKAVISKPQG